MLGGTRFPFSSLSDRAFDRLFYISDTTLSAYNQPPCVYTLESVYSIYIYIVNHHIDLELAEMLAAQS